MTISELTGMVILLGIIGLFSYVLVLIITNGGNDDDFHCW